MPLSSFGVFFSVEGLPKSRIKTSAGFPNARAKGGTSEIPNLPAPRWRPPQSWLPLQDYYSGLIRVVGYLSVPNRQVNRLVVLYGSSEPECTIGVGPRKEKNDS